MAEIDSQSIAENANAPKAVTKDGESVTAHSISDQIAADKYNRRAKAAKKPWRCLKRAQFVPPSTTDQTVPTEKL